MSRSESQINKSLEFAEGSFFHEINIHPYVRISMSSITLLDEITNRINTMNAENVIDVTICNSLTELKEKMIEIKKMWLKINHENNFGFFRAVGAVELLLEQMMERFQIEVKYDDLQIVQDSSEVIPLAREIIQLVEQYNPDDKLAEQISEKRLQLRDLVEEKNLLESDERNLRDVDKNTLDKIFCKMLKNMDVSLKVPSNVSIDEIKNTS
ncbi:MAG: hypothetical protein OXC46_10385 [Thaumarchaeota archaeon]|nr:hypothetical protein [Nitrososphaerota archaeon]